LIIALLPIQIQKMKIKKIFNKGKIENKYDGKTDNSLYKSKGIEIDINTKNYFNWFVKRCK